MTTTARPDLAPSPAGVKSGRWLTEWDPEDTAFWARRGSRVARRNLICSICTEHVGFSVWSLWSVFVLFLTPSYGISPDAKTAAAEKFLLTALPAALGAAVRLPYTFAVARLGGRNWTIISALLLLVPTIGAAVALRPGAGYATLLVVAALAGVGGGNFASSMANINSFYPQRLKGRALGLNAGFGNLGVAAVQLAGLAVLAIAGHGHPRLMLGIYIPLVVASALTAALFMDNIAGLHTEQRALRDAAREPHTWIISLLYIGTFGSFIGFSFAFGLVLQDQFGSHFLTAGQVNPVKVAGLTFLGPLVGSLSRPAGGWLADRIGGAWTTLGSFMLLVLATAAVLAASLLNSLGLFYAGFVALFVLSGIGNGSTYKMIPAVFRGKSQLANAVIGIAGAAGAAGGVLVNVAFRQSFLATGNGDAAYLGFIACYGGCAALTWLAYLRPSRRVRLAGV